MKQGFFITGTDTGVGKTWFTVLLMNYLQQQGLLVNGMKPIASGAEQQDNRLVNEDALQILEACSASLDYELVNPQVYEPPVAPHIAAQQSRQPIDIEKIMQSFNQLGQASDVLIVEGVGGWRVPVNTNQTLTELVRQMALPVIMVVGLRLGCINHALLTAEAVRNDGLELTGWALSELDAEYLYKEETISTIEDLAGAPMIAEIPHSGSVAPNTAVLNITSSGRGALRL